jgi:hypothetical protein
MADVNITFPDGTELRWQLPDPDAGQIGGDVADAITAVLGEPDDVHTWQDRPSV